MARKPGSGLAGPTTAAVEELAAAVFRGDRDLRPFVRRIDKEVDRGLCDVSGSDTARWLRNLADQAGLEVESAVSPSLDLLGDVRLTLKDGSTVWIEVKAPTKKRFGELLQTDWVRDETDALRWLSRNEPDVKRLLSPWVHECLQINDPTWQFGNLGFTDLWLADLALLPDRPRRAVAGVKGTADLLDFLGKKYLLHLTTEGARLVRLDGLACVQRASAGEKLWLDVNPGGKCDAIVWLSGRGAPRRGAIDFVYYVGYRSGVLGRHKLHPSAVATAAGLMVATK